MLGNRVPIDGKMNRNKYFHVLNDYALTSVDNLIGESFIFQQDNAPCRNAKSINQFSNEISVRTLNWAPQSPDKGFLKNIWAYVKRKLTIDLARTRENTIFEVKYVLKDFSLQYILKLVDNAPSLQKAVRAMGGYKF